MRLPDQDKRSKIYLGLTIKVRDLVGYVIWIIDKLRTCLYLGEFQDDLDVPIQIEIEYQLEGNKVISSFLSSKIRYNRPLLIKEARSRSVAEFDHIINQEVQRAIESHFCSRGYVFEK
jgi:hypothetical protein